MIALTAALLLAVTPAAKVDYQGPLGLKWGMTPAEVKAALAERLEFVDETPSDGGVSVMQRYAGTFADFSTQRVEVTFWEGKLLIVTAVLAPEDPRPVDILWQQAVAAMSSSYGAPASVTELPRLAREAKRDKRPMTWWYKTTMRAEVEEALLTREWKPAARWDFRNKAQCIVAIHAGPTALELSDFRVIWGFSDGTRFKAWSDAVDKAKPPDF